MSTNATTDDKKTLVAEYEKITGKKNGKFLAVSKLEEEIHKKKTILPEKLEPLVPVFIDSEPFGIIRGKYVPWKQAKIEYQENNVALEILKLEKLKDDNR